MLAPAKLSEYQIKRDGLDVVLASGFSDLPLRLLYGREGVYGIAKRRLSKLEIARLPRIAS